MPKIFMECDDGQVESLLSTKLGNGYRIENTPFFAYGIGWKDVVSAKADRQGNLWLSDILEHSGHSTYRIATSTPDQRDAFPEKWKHLELLGCTYESFEGSNMDLYAVDVPPSTNLGKVYEYLETLEEVGLWEFEEGYAHL